MSSPYPGEPTPAGNPGPVPAQVVHDAQAMAGPQGAGGYPQVSAGYQQPGPQQPGPQQYGYQQAAPVFQQAAAYPQAYRPGGFAPSPAERGSQNAAMSPPPNTSGPIDQMWASGQRTSNRSLFEFIGIAIFAVMLIVMLVIIFRMTGVGEATAGFVLAFVPLTIVLAGVLWLDRWEPEPKLLLLFALIAGAGGATLTALVVNTAVVQWIFNTTGDGQSANIMGAVVVAPVVEETAKGLIVLVLFLIRRQQFDGPVDGVVYAATVAAGFAFTENILYFAQSADVVWVVFVMRGLVSPFAHLIFTACTGIAIGMAARSRNSTAIVFAFPVGLLGAMGLHALWNGSASLGSSMNFIWIYLLVQIPLFIAIVVLMFWLRRQEANVVRARLGEYAQAGWFAPHEVFMLASMRMRRQARDWAARYGPRARQSMKEFQRDATTLAYLRQRQLTGRTNLRASQSEHELLNELGRDRQTFVTAAQGQIQQPQS